MELRVVRVTDRFDEACRFYGETLRWPVTREWDDGPGSRGRIFGYGDVGRIELMDGPPEPVRGVMLSIEEQDVVALHARLVAANVAIDRGVADQPWGHRSFAVTDPAGIQLVFFQWIEATD
jgi:catechol 2,3-dioxygenase-like lactoylglutathione lyase family enzyme